jgi:mRNA-degrading endonuclease toxin of MazEF toxin-antitoxin module
VLVSLSGDYAKTRPALVIQSGLTLAITGSVTFCLITSELVDNARLRITIDPDAGNGLWWFPRSRRTRSIRCPPPRSAAPSGELTGRLNPVSTSLSLSILTS